MEDYFNEEVLQTEYSKGMFRRLLKYARPYWGMILGAIGLLLLTAVAQITYPYLIKESIDGYIMPYWQEVRVVEGDSVLTRLRAAKPQTFRTMDDGMVLVDMRTDRRIFSGAIPLDAKDIAGLRKAGLLTGGRFLVREGVPSYPADSQRVLGIKSGPGCWAIGSAALSKLNSEQSKRLRERDLKGIAFLALLYILIRFITFGLTYVQVYVMNLLSQRIMYDTRMHLFEHITRQGLRYFDENPVGRLVTRVTNDVGTINEMYTSVMINLFRDIFTLVAILIVLLLLDARLALIIVAMGPVIFAAAWIFRRRFRQAYRTVRVRLARVNATLSEHINGMRIIQSFAREDHNKEQFAEVNKQHYQANIRQLLVEAGFRPLVDVLAISGTGMLIYFGGGEVIRDRISLGTLVAFLGYIGMFFGPIQALTEKFNIFQSAMAAAERIFIILDRPEDLPDRPDALPIDRVKGEIEFEGVTFAYRGDDHVLRDISFRVPAGQKVALVGHTGSGKTTTISLLARLYDLNEGTIRVDGRDIREYRKEDYRRQVGVVMQNVFLFSGDIAHNIRLNNAEITDEKLRAAAKMVNADRFIDRLDGGYAAGVNERGTTLSAGQRQLLAFARALAFDPAILVLDEATANVDTETEQLIQEGIKRLMEGRTAIIVAHRLSTIQHVDRILVFHKGRIVESGNHQELLARKGVYHTLYQLQFQGQNQEPAPPVNPLPPPAPTS